MQRTTKKAASIKRGDVIIMGKGENPPLGTVSHIFKRDKVIVFCVHREGDRESLYHSVRFKFSDKVPIMKQ